MMKVVGVEMNHLGEVFPGSRLELHKLLRQQGYLYVGTIRKHHSTWCQKAAYIRRNLPMVERVLKILKLIVISPHDSIKCQSWGGFEKIAFYHYKKAHFYTVGQNQFF